MNEPLHDVKSDLVVLQQLLKERLLQHFKAAPADEAGTPVLPLSFAKELQLGPDEQVILLIALLPHIQPNFFENVIQEVLPQGGDFPQFGGVRGSNHRGLLPTGETVQFILAGDDFTRRLWIQQLLLGESRLVKENIAEMERVKKGEPFMSGRIIITDEWLYKLLTGHEASPKFSPDFPARKVTTSMSWEELILNPYTQSQLQDMMIWLQHNAAIMEDKVLGKKIKPGYRALFYGPPGTGKTLTAALLGMQFNKDVYRIDISQMVSKYIGETEKNLEKVFAKAEHKDWILFFDEADALFGKRTSVQSSHDRYANQEVSYLLQRVEDYPGMLILASNFKSNMDDAFLRRFHNIIHFPNPQAADRLKLWKKTWPANYKPEAAINLNELAEKYELNGATILNVVYGATLKSASRYDEYIRYADIVDAIKKEYHKEERSM